MKPFSDPHDWISTAEELITYELTCGQLENITLAKFSPEAAVIAKLIDTMKLDCYIDLGCWYGFLLEEVLKRVQPLRVIAVDAVQGFLSVAQQRLGSDLVAFYCRTIVPRHARLRTRPDFRLHTGDSSESGIELEGGIPIIPGRSVDLVRFLRRHGGDIGRAYVKLDIEGLDAQLVCEMLANGVHPAVLHFEYLPWLDYQAAFTALARAGYRVPEVQPGHRFYSVACSRLHAVLIGFEPTEVYTNSGA